MKIASAALESHLAQDLTTLATCWRVERVDGEVITLTDHDADIIYDGLTYTADGGFTRSAVKSQLDLDIDTLDVEGILSSDQITEDDIRAGRYNGAEIYVFVINWADTSQGIIKIKRGLIGEIKVQNGIYIAELQGLSQYLSNEILEQYTAECQADFGDSRCGFDTDTLKQSSTVISVSTDRLEFVVQESVGSGSPGIDFSLTGLPSYGYDHGKLTWTSGENNGIIQEVKIADSVTATLTLYLKSPFSITVGDTFDLTAGCDKRFATCQFFGRQKFFRGFPDVPGQDRYLNYPDARA